MYWASGAYIYITTACNLDCKYCFEKLKGSEKMDIELIKKIVKNLVDNAKIYNKISTIVFFGGEPLLEKDKIIQVAKYIQENNWNKYIQIFIITNATIVDDKLLEVLGNTGIRVSISISFDGPKEVHDANRIFPGEKGSFEIVYRNIQKIKKFSKKHKNIRFAVRATVAKNTAKFFPKTIEFFFKEKLPFAIEFDVYNFDEEFEKTIRSQYNEIVKLAKKYEDLITLWSNYNRFVEAYFRPPQAKSCSVGEEVAIDTSGDIWPCHRIYELSKVLNNKTWWMGNAIRKEYNIDIIKTFRELDFRKVEKCRECEIFGFCMGGCAATHITYTGRPDTPAEKFCRAEKTLAELLFRILKHVGKPIQITDEHSIYTATGRVAFAFRNVPKNPWDVYIPAPDRIAHYLPPCLGGNGKGTVHPPYIRFLKLDTCKKCKYSKTCQGIPVWIL